MGGAGKPVLLGAARPKPKAVRKTRRVKLEFGEEIRAVDLPLPSDLQELVGIVREEFSTDNLDLRYHPSPVIKVEVLVHAARHLPKADREGLCDAVVRAEVTPKDVYRYTGFYTVATRGRTRTIPKSLNPEFNETLVLLVDGRGDPEENGRPRLLLTVSDSDDGQEEMIGQVDLDLADAIAVTARCHVWERQEQVLREKLQDMQSRSGGSLSEGLQQVKEASLSTSINYLARRRRHALAALESMWVDINWVPGCIPSTKVEGEGSDDDLKPRVRGADSKMAILHVGLRVSMSEYQQNCWLNSYYSFLDNVLEEARGSLKHRADQCKEAIAGAAKKLTRRHFYSATDNLIGSEVTLQKGGITDPAVRKVLLDIIVNAMVRVIRFSKAAGNEPTLPMRHDDEIQIDTTRKLKMALAEWKVTHETAVPRILLRAHLRISVYRCLQLPKTDKAGTCDAYIKAVVGTQTAETDVKFRSLNPSWGIEQRGGKGFTGQHLLIDCRNPSHEIRTELWDFDELKALDIKSRTTTVTRNDEFIGVAYPARLDELLKEGSSKRDFFKFKDPETGGWVRGFERLRDQRDQDTRVEVEVTCVPAWKALVERSSSFPQDSDLPALQSPISDEGEAEEGEAAAAVEEEDTSPEGRLLELFERFAMHGKVIAAQKKADLKEQEALHRDKGGGVGRKSKKALAAAAWGGGVRREGAAKAGESAGRAVAGAAVQGNRMFTMDQPEFLAFLDHQVWRENLSLSEHRRVSLRASMTEFLSLASARAV